jgi:hypothetical protein
MKNRKCPWKKRVKDTKPMNGVSPRSAVSDLRRIFRGVGGYLMLAGSVS